MKEDSRSKEEILKELEELKEENKGLKKALNSYFPEFSFNQNYFSLLLDSIIIGVVVHNSSGKIIYTNKATENILGLSKDEILGVKDIDPQWKLIHKEGRELYPSEIPSKITLETGTAIFDYTLGVKNNEEITWLSVTSKPIYSLEQEVQFVLVSFSNITDLKITEEQLKRITNFLQSALNAVDLGIWSWDIVSNTVEWSDGVHKIFGLQRDEFKGTYQEYLNLLPEEDRILVENKIQEALTNKDKDYFVQHRLIRKNSDIIWVEGKGKVYRDINGNPTKMLGTIMDISYQKKTEEEIKKNTFLIETAGRIAKLGGWEFNLKKMNIIWSEEVYNIYEIDKNIQPSLKIVYKGFSKKDYLKFKEKSQQALEKFSSFDGEFEITTASNKKRWVRIIGYFEKSQVIDSKRLIGTIQDITEKKLSEEALRQSEKRFEVFYDLATEGLCIFNKEFEVLDSNSAFIELFNLGSKKVLNISLTNILTEDSFNKLKNIMEAGNTIIEPIQLVGKKINGSLFSIQCKFNLLYYKKGLVYIANFIDLTSEKEADRLRALNEEMLAKNELIQKQKEELEYTVSNLNQTQNQLIVSEKLASLGQLIAGIAHELNNPIGAIKATNNNSKILFSDFLSSLKVSVSQLNKLNQIEWDNVFNFIKSIIKENTVFQGSESRKFKRALTENLKIYPFDDPEMIADYLVDLGVTEINNEIKFLFEDKEFHKIIDLIIIIINYMKSNDNINLAVDKISKVVYSLKNFSRVNNSGAKVKTNVIDTIETVLTLYHNQLKFNVNIIKKYEPIPEIFCYEEDLFHVWSNLIYNALQAMQFKGNLELGTEVVSDFVKITIKDDGAGIPLDVQQKIFEPFFTTKKSGEGTGLGLDIARRIIEKHSGQILFDSVPGETSFYIYLPINED